MFVKFIHGRKRCLKSLYVAIHPKKIIIGLFLALHLSCVKYVCRGLNDPNLPYNMIVVGRNEDAIRIWSCESTSQNRVGQVYRANLEKPRQDWCYCLRRLHSTMLIFQKLNLYSFASCWNMGNVLLGRYITPVVVMKKSKTDTFDDDSLSPWRPAFYVGVACAVGLNVLYILRKIIVVSYGYKRIRIPVSSYDRRSLSEIARNQASQMQRRFFNLLNTCIYILVIGLLISFFLLAIIELNKAGLGRIVFQLGEELMNKIRG